jgi:conjugal transfer pilus assembly protein TraV
LWFAPWEDTDGDLHDQSYVYLMVDAGNWLVEHNRQRIQAAYKPVYAPAQSSVTPSLSSETLINNRAASEQGEISISGIRSRSSEQEAAALMNNIQTPGQFNQQ